MPIIESAKKQLRASKRRRVNNLKRKDAINSVLKEFKKLVLEKKVKEAKVLISKAQQALDKAVKTNLIKKNTASRKKSRLAKMIKKIS